MNNIHAEVDEILRTGNKKAIVSLFLSMQGNYIRATEAEAKLAEARAEIERLKNEHEDSLRRAKDNAVSLSGTVTEYAGELLAKDKQLAEARAEIERLNKGIKIVQSAFKNYKNADAIIARTTLKKAQILSASCNSDAVDSERAANEMLTEELEQARADIKDRDNAIAAIMAVLPDSAKPCDAPSLILHFKQQMGAYSGRCMQLEKQLADARAEIERLKRCCNCEYANHKLEICEHPDNEPETFMDGVCDLWSHNI